MAAPNITEITGWLTQREADELHTLAAGRRCLEVGSYCGRSSIAIGAAAESLDCVDPFDGRGTPVPRGTLGVFRENVRRYGLVHTVTPHPMTLEQWASVTRVKSFDFIFLDAEHTAAAATADLEILARYAATYGVVAIHDYANPDFPGVAVACGSIFHRPPDRRVDSLAVYLSDGPFPGRLLHVVTPLSRPQNLKLVQASILELMKTLPGWVVRWHVYADRRIDYPEAAALAYATGRQSPGGCCGNAGRNDALDSIRAGWVCFLDDDNTFHPDFAPGLAEAVRAHPDAVGFAFEQVKADGSVRLSADAWKSAPAGAIDTAQFVFRRDAIGAHRWPRDVYAADGVFFRAVARGGPEPVTAPGRVYYNKLRNE